MSPLYSRVAEFVQTIRKSPIVIYSFVLIVSITVIIFLNAYYSARKFETVIDALNISRGSLVADVLAPTISEWLAEPERLNERFTKIVSENSGKQGDLLAISLLMLEGEHFVITVSSDSENIGMTMESRPFFDAYNSHQGLPYMYNEVVSGTRLWNALKPVASEGGARGLLLVQFSLEKYDRYVEAALQRVYFVTVVVLFIILLLILNHARLLTFATRVAHLEEVDRMKDDFVSMASHELKSPLTVLNGYLELLHDGLKKKVAPESATEEYTYIKRMQSSVGHLNELIEDILNVSRLEQNRLPIRKETFDSGALVETLVEQYRVLASGKGLSLEYTPSQVPLLVVADPARTKQILSNLLSNAVKYTEKGKVEVLVRPLEDTVRVTVADTGLGIGAEALTHLFEKFYRVRTESTASISGTGLGLWISREIARKMGGDLTVESIAGVGSHFTVILPYDRETQKTDEDRRV